MIDKYKTCKDCPDRSISPNCHSICEGYLDRVRKNKEISETRRKQLSTIEYEFDKNSKLQKKKVMDLKRNRNRKR